MQVLSALGVVAFMSTSENRPPEFIQRLAAILEYPPHQACIHWDPKGTIVILSSPKRFCKEVLPHLTGAKSLASFVRQMNIYGFHKKRTEVEGQIIFENLLFRRNETEMQSKIRRKPDAKLRRNSILKTKRDELCREIKSLRGIDEKLDILGDQQMTLLSTLQDTLMEAQKLGEIRKDLWDNME